MARYIIAVKSCNQQELLQFRGRYEKELLEDSEFRGTPPPEIDRRPKILKRQDLIANDYSFTRRNFDLSDLTRPHFLILLLLPLANVPWSSIPFQFNLAGLARGPYAQAHITLRSIIISRHVRKEGVGKRLLNIFHGFAAATGFSHVQLQRQTGEYGQRLAGFYSNNGYQQPPTQNPDPNIEMSFPEIYHRNLVVGDIQHVNPSPGSHLPGMGVRLSVL